MQLSLVAVEQVVHLLHIPEVVELEDFRKVGHLQPTQSQLELVELALLPQQVEHLEPPHNMGWCLLAVDQVVLLQAQVEEQQEPQQSPQLLQPQRFLTQERLLLESMSLDMQAVAVLLEVLLEQQEFQLVAVAVVELQAAQVVAVSFVAVEVLPQQLELSQVALAALVISTLEALAQRVLERVLELEAAALVTQAQDQQVQEPQVAMVAPVGAVEAVLELMELLALVEMALSIFITKERNGYTIPISMSHL
jgi:hypothetical protein